MQDRDYLRTRDNPLCVHSTTVGCRSRSVSIFFPVSSTYPDLASRRRFKARDDDDDETAGSSFHERRCTLSKNINTIRVPQRLYMPGISHLLDEIDPLLLADRPEIVQLWLPSDLPPSDRDEWCASDLPGLEYRLRYATAVNALQDVRCFR